MPEAARFLTEFAVSPYDLFSADAVAHWPEGVFDELLEQGLLVPAEMATHVTCNACSDEHIEEVLFVEAPPGSARRAYIMCPEAGRVRVDLNRLRQWAVDAEKLKSLTGWKPARHELDADAIKMTIAEAARFVRVADRTIRAWRKNRKLNVVQDEDGHLVFSKSELQMFRDAQ